MQSCGIDRRIRKADKRFEIGEYYLAGQMYRDVYPFISYKNKSLKGRIAFRMGQCYRVTNQNSRAEQAYTNAFKNGYADTDSSLVLNLAQVYKKNAKYAEAAEYFDIYLRKDSGNVVAKNGRKTAKLLAEWKKNPTRYQVKKTTEFNQARASSFSPSFLGGNSDMIIFTSTRPLAKKNVKKNSPITGFPTNNLFASRKNSFGKWEVPDLLDGEINSQCDEGVCSVSEDGKTIYFTRSSNNAVGDRGTEIFISNRAGGTWSAPTRLKIFKDTTISVAHPAISPDGHTLYFVSDFKPGSFGGKDIWRGTIEGTECKFIENLGAQINTSGDEMFPTMRSDGTLYFSSDGHLGFGGLDIFKASAKKDSGWVVENMGLPINSNADDFGMIFMKDAEKGFFSTNRDEIKPYDAIWSFELPDLIYALEGNVVDEKGTPIPDAKIKLVSNTGFKAKVSSKKDGSYRMKIEKDMESAVLATARGYLNQKAMLSTMGLKGSKTFKYDFKLVSISKPIQMDNIFYEYGKWELTSTSTESLQALVKLLNDNPNITIEVSAHTDYVGNNEANKVLSEKRAKSVVDYLIKSGIAPDRLSSVGYGEEIPVTVDASIVKRFKFLKEGMVLDEATITKLKPDQQAQANQVNRRTEFRVVKTTYKLY